jgi:UDP-glucuronate 4-epimerase
MRTVLITGTAGFIGFHLARLLLAEGFRVVGYDGMTPYYDVDLKRARHQMLQQSPGFSCDEGMLEDMARLQALCRQSRPEIIIHLAAQAGVRYSLENPRAYAEANLLGSFNLLECARDLGVRHLLMASTSSVYGANAAMPYAETQRTAHPLTLYAATKQANESMAHAYAHLWNLPVTLFRFFTVYGPWGRPDMALFRFVQAALAGEPIEVYGHGRMARDFTYVGDLVQAVRRLIDVPPALPEDPAAILPDDSLSPVAPWRIVNIGNSTRVPLMDFVAAVETAVGAPVRKEFRDMQPGDMPETWADSGLLERLTGFRPDTPVAEGVAAFVAWYREHYRV